MVIQIPQTINESTSATGTAHHTPVMPHNVENEIKQMSTNTKLRSVEMSAEMPPFESAVNIFEVIRLNPANKKPVAKIRKPPLAIANNSVPGATKIPTKNSLPNMQDA